ncbi:MAG TPA: hypothetical protein PK073_01305 [Ignavibacteriaceae bacterium]|nr:hypothetical protein [Ignavibacteriaceae bacterium]HQI41987.1 hypothetical protein [Ignavibacteriaceae bacterium]
MMRLSFKIAFLFLFLTEILLPQSDSIKYNETKLMFNPRFTGVQVEATSLLVVNELGGLVDFDLYSSANKYYNIGVRFSIEYHKLLNLDVGGAGQDETVFNYNLYARHTIKGSVFWFSFLAGVSLQKQSEDFQTKTNFVPRAGFELKYNLTEYEIGILLKGAKSFLEKSGYIGIGLSFGFHLL